MALVEQLLLQLKVGVEVSHLLRIKQLKTLGLVVEEELEVTEWIQQVQVFIEIILVMEV